MRTSADLRAVLRDVLDAIEEHEAYRDDTSAEKLFKRVPWIREVLDGPPRTDAQHFGEVLKLAKDF